MSKICLDIDLNNVCRICLSQTDISEHLFNIFSDAIVDGMLVSLPEVIDLCVDVQVREIDGVPNKICQSCKGKMFKFYVFKLKCHRTDSVLRSMLESKPPSSETDAVEFEDEECKNGLTHASLQPVIESDDAFTGMCTPEMLLSMDNVEELSLQEDSCSDANQEADFEYGSPSVEHVSLGDHDNVSSVALSPEEEYIEEMYEVPSSSPTMSSATLEENRSREQVHVTITQMSANRNHSIACDICGLSCTSRARLVRHMKLHNDSNAVLSQMSFFSCTGCGTMYLSEANFNEHSRACPRLMATDGDDDHHLNDDYSSLERINAGGIAHCGICDASYSSAVQLKQHVITHMEKFSCPFEGCGCEYVSLARLNIHVNSKHVDYFPPTCPHCKEQIDRADLIQHLRLSCKAKQFRCSHCDKKFLSSRALSQHLKNLEQTFQCTQCDKSYSSRANLKLHQRTHSSDRPFVCTVCNKSYKTASMRTAHMDSHIEGKTFECTICGKFLQTRTCYRNHVKRHLEERKHGCDVCGKKFYNKYNLRVHQKVVHKLKRGLGSDQD